MYIYIYIYTCIHRYIEVTNDTKSSQIPQKKDEHNIFI